MMNYEEELKNINNRIDKINNQLLKLTYVLDVLNTLTKSVSTESIVNDLADQIQSLRRSIKDIKN